MLDKSTDSGVSKTYAGLIATVESFNSDTHRFETSELMTDERVLYDITVMLLNERRRYMGRERRSTGKVNPASKQWDSGQLEESHLI